MSRECLRMRMNEPSGAMGGSERHSDAVGVGEVETDVAGAFDKGVTLGVLDVEVRGKVGRGWGGENEDGAALVFVSDRVNEGGAGSLEVDVLNLDVLFQGWVSGEQTEHFDAAWAIVGALGVVMEVGADKVEGVGVHGWLRVRELGEGLSEVG